ncbi:phage tail tape measure protein [Rhodovulum sp. BSW8]|uniref:phage tail tape measure protein n=1 Tax=Rhodovulum sp. BSW8 TaxID=2259645 RepID=UPI000DE3A9A3|nr:phage tail tape measure protein [Rhodovulum sp. BSW8]RBO54068.1 phage tail tape measure protein [Rhodovulum sp. BSW8]
MAIEIGVLRALLSLDSAAFESGVKRAQAGMNGLQRSLARTADRMKEVGQTLSLRVTAPIAGAGALILKTAGDFEASMNRVRAALGASDSEFNALREAARNMGATTQFTAAEAADAIEILAKNGLSASEILGGALKSSLMLAASSSSDLASAGDLATDVMLNFGKRAEDLGKVTDLVTGALLQSKFGFDDYRLALGQAGGAVAGVGVSFEDFNAAIAATSSSFASGSDAGTSFKNFVQRLVPVSSTAAAEIQNLGFQFFDAEGNMRSMAEIAQELQDKLSGLTEERRMDVVTTIFGTDSGRTALALMREGADGINEMKAAIDKASATEQAQARMKGLNGALRRLSSSFQELQLTIADTGLLDMVTDLVGRFTNMVGALGQLDPKFVRIGVAIAAAAAAIGPMAIGAGLLATGLAALATPVGAIVLGFGAMAGAAAYAAIEWESLTKRFPKTTGALKEIAKSFADAMREGSKGFWDDETRAKNREKNEQVIAEIRQSIVDGLAGAREWFNGLDQAIMGVARDVVTSAREIGSSILEGIKAGILEGWEGLKTWFSDQIKTIFSVPGASEAGRRAGQGIAEDLGAGLAIGMSGAGADAAAAARDAANYIEEAIRDESETRSPSRAWMRIGRDLMDGLRGGISGNLQAAAETARAAGAAVTSGVGGEVQYASASFKSFFRDVIKGSGDAGDAISALADRMLDDLLDRALTPISNAFGSVFEGLFSGLFATAGGGTGTVKPVAGLIAQGIAGARASGGPVSGGKSYLVGEMGPEIFTPRMSGQIIPNGAFSTNSGGGGSVRMGDIYVSVGQTNADPRQIAEAVRRVAREEAQIAQARTARVGKVRGRGQ